MMYLRCDAEPTPTGVWVEPVGHARRIFLGGVGDHLVAAAHAAGLDHALAVAGAVQFDQRVANPRVDAEVADELHVVLLPLPPRGAAAGKNWWRIRDSNTGHADYDSAALTS